MSKTKQYYSDNAENQVDKIIACMKSGQIDEDKANEIGIRARLFKIEHVWISTILLKQF